MKKKLVKELRRVAVELPDVMRNTKEKHLVKGSEMIAEGQFEIDNPRYLKAFPNLHPKMIRVNPEAMYVQEMPVKIAINHQRKLKKMFKKMGENGVHAYVSAVMQHVSTIDQPAEVTPRK